MVLSQCGLKQRLSQVVFELHPSFTVPIRSIDAQPFELTESGWGEFEVNVKVRVLACKCCNHHHCTDAVFYEAVCSVTRQLPLCPPRCAACAIFYSEGRMT